MQIHNTLPNKDDNYWQIDILPSIHFLRSKGNEGVGKYAVVGLQWLFWSLTFTIYE